MSHEKKKPDVTVYVINLVKDLVKDRIKYVVYIALSSFALWGWNSFINATDKFTTLPKKYERLLEIRANDSIKAYRHLKNDSLMDIINANKFNALSFKVDSIAQLHKQWIYQLADTMVKINGKLTKNNIR